MPKYYKLTNKNDQTYGGCQWGENVTIKTSGKGDLCGPGWTHWYTHPLLAVMLNPIHGDFDLETAHLWESQEDQVAEISDHGLKVGCKNGTTVRRIPLPEVSLTQKIAFGILASLEVPQKPSYIKWANNWLSGKDRSEAAAEAAAWTAKAAAWAAAKVAKVAAEAAAWTAKAAAWAAAKVAKAAAEAAAEAAAWTAKAATINKPIDPIALAEKAMQVIE